MARNRFRSLSSPVSAMPDALPGLMGQEKSKALKRAGGVMLAVLVAGLFSVSGAEAALTYSGDLNPADPATWTGGTSGTSASVGNTGVGALIVDGGSTLATRLFTMGSGSGSNGTVTITGTGTIVSTTYNVFPGYSGTGTLNITNGGTLSLGGLVYVGYGGGGTGTLNVDGSNTVQNWGGLEIGTSGTGSLTITNGARINNGSYGVVGYNAGSNGTVTVDGAGSALTNSGWFRVGNSGTGTMNITSGGTVNSLLSAGIGYNAGSSGTVTVSGAGSAWNTTGDLSIGYGRLNIYNGGTVTVTGATNGGGAIDFGAGGGTLTTGTIGISTLNITGTGTINTNGGTVLGDCDLLFDATHGLSGTATVSDASRNLTINYNLAAGSDMYVGYGKNSSLAIRDGFTLSSGTGYVGYLSGSAGAVAVDGAGSHWALGGSLYVGNSGTGTLSITNGGAVTVANTLYTGASLISGTGTISAAGIVSDMNIAFDGAHGAAQSIGMNGAILNLNQSSSGALGAGYIGSGTLAISDGVSIASSSGYLGHNSGSTGIATVTGSGSTWTNSGSLYVGNSGTGTLNITNGGKVTNTAGYVGNNAGSAGMVAVNGAESTWANSGILYVGNSGSGAVSIANGGKVSNTNGYLGYNAGSTGKATVDGAGSSWTNSSTLYVGRYGTATLSITNGGKVSNTTGYLGYNAGSTGMATVDGAGSSWTSSSTLYVGSSGSGNLRITNGGGVSSTAGRIGYNSGSTGTVSVDGSGSAWTITGALNIGYTGSGTRTGRLYISDGGSVTAGSVAINAVSMLTADIGRGSSLIAGGGTGTITNAGTIRMVAGANAANGTYTPVSAGTWTNTGTIQALGGIWDATAHTVTVSGAATGAAGSALTADLAATQRFLFTDGATGKQVGAGFQATTNPTNLTMTASAIGGSELTSLLNLLGTGQAVLSGWDFNATEGYTEGNPAYLSLFAGSGHNLSDLTVWHYDGSAWNKYDASDLAYDNSYASFTVTGLSGYAVSGTAPVPIPAAAWLLGSGLIGLIGARRRFFRV